MVYERVRLASAPPELSTMKQWDDERMSIFGSSEWPKPIVGRPTGIDKTGKLAKICDSTGVTLLPPIKGGTTLPPNLPTPSYSSSSSVPKCSPDCPLSRLPYLLQFSIPSPVPHSHLTETATFTHHSPPPAWLTSTRENQSTAPSFSNPSSYTAYTAKNKRQSPYYLCFHLVSNMILSVPTCSFLINVRP